MPRNSSLILLSTIIASTALMACASSSTASASKEDDKPDPRRGEKVDRICFGRNIDSFSSTSSRSVVLRKSRSEEYLVETSSCFPLKRAQRIILEPTTSCLSRGDRLIVSENFFPGNDTSRFDVDRCYVQAIYKWDRNATDEDESGDDAEE